MDQRSHQREPFRVAEQSIRPGRRVFVSHDRSAAPVPGQRERVIAVQDTLSSIFFAGSPKPLNITTSLDPFRTGSGRWLDAQGNVLPKNGERMLKSDYKLELRSSKTFSLHRVQLQGMIDVFNVLNTKNWGSDGTTFGTSTYLRPGSSTNLFYQPRQVQFGVRATF